MSEKTDYRQLLVLPDDDVSGWSGFEALKRSEDCPPIAALIRLSLGIDSGSISPDHIANCKFCSSWLKGYNRPSESDDLVLSVPTPTAEKQVPVSSAPLLPTGPLLSESVGGGSAILTGGVRTRVTRGDFAGAIKILSPLLEVLLAEVGLDPCLRDDLQQFIQNRLPHESWQNPVLPRWLNDFAREELGFPETPCRLQPEEWEDSMRLALERALYRIERDGAAAVEGRQLYEKALNEHIRCKDLETVANQLFGDNPEVIEQLQPGWDGISKDVKSKMNRLAPLL